jgi:hypothetical protein
MVVTRTADGDQAAQMGIVPLAVRKWSPHAQPATDQAVALDDGCHTHLPRVVANATLAPP